MTPAKILLTLLLAFILLITCQTANATTIHAWGTTGTGNGEFLGPDCIKIAPNGYVYVAELDNRVQKFTITGEYVAQYDIHARMIAFAPDGTMYATVNDTVEKYSSSMSLIDTWGTTGTGDGEFDFPIGINVTNGKVYVVDSGNNRVQVFDTDGNYEKQWGSYGSTNGSFSGPTDIEIDQYGSIYVADLGNNRIQVFDGDGYVTQWGELGNDTLKYNGSIGLAVTLDKIYVADYYNGRIAYYNITPFGYAGEYTGLSGPVDADANGTYLYVVENTDDRVALYYEQPTVSLTESTKNGIEGSDITLTTSLSYASPDTITVDVNTSDGTAVSGTDYVAVSQTLTFAPGNVSQNLGVHLEDDYLNTSPVRRYLTVQLSNAVNGTIGNNSSCRVYINDSGQYVQPISTLINSSIPSTMINNSTYAINMTFENTGTYAWRTDGVYLLGADDVYLFAHTKYVLNETVQVGGTVTYSFNVTAPANGTYDLRYVMRAKNEEIFGAEVNRTVTVT